MKAQLTTIVLKTTGAALALTGCFQKTDGDKTQINTTLECGEDTIRCVECEPGELDCDGATLLACGDDGLGFAVQGVCESAQLCAEGLVMGSCVEPLCVAGERACVGAIMQTCATGRHRQDLQVCESEDACLRGLDAGVCAAVECSASSDCTGEDTQCRRRRCNEGRCEVENLPGDVACVIGQVNGRCDGDGSCKSTEECTIASDCPGQDTECRLRACQDGACFLVDLPSSTPCVTTSVNGECNGEGACVAVDECNIASDCPGQDTQCQIRACNDGACLMVPLPESSVCDVGGFAGACDGAGRCAVEADCTVASDCPGNDSACGLRACNDGACGFDFMDAGTSCDVGGLGGECDGAGSCNITDECLRDTDCPGISTECRQPRCTNGRCGFRNLNGSCTKGISEGRCSGGECECVPVSFQNIEFCANECVPTVDNDEHCGNCGNRCDPSTNKVCDGTSCRCPPEWFSRECGGVCYNALEDERHCGFCNNACPNNAFCSGDPVAGCNVSPAACYCELGFLYCDNPTDRAYDGECVQHPSDTWDLAGCQMLGNCGGRKVP